MDTSYLFFSPHNVFYSSQKTNINFSHNNFVICKCFQSRSVLNSVSYSHNITTLQMDTSFSFFSHNVFYTSQNINFVICKCFQSRSVLNSVCYSHNINTLHMDTSFSFFSHNVFYTSQNNNFVICKCFQSRSVLNSVSYSYNISTLHMDTSFSFFSHNAFYNSQNKYQFQSHQLCHLQMFSIQISLKFSH